MKVRIKTTDDTYFHKLLLILNNIPPFDKLRPQELELYSYLLSLNHKYRTIPFKERNKLIFNFETKTNIASAMSIKLSGVYNILSNLRTLKLLEEDSLIPKFVLNKTNELVFIFDEED